jgi:Ca2+-binding RTX toxin-like protein
MTDIYITNLGSAWTGGASVNSVAIGEPGIVFLAGAEREDMSTLKLNPLVRAYKDGSILWEADIPDVGTSIELRSATYRDGIVYVVGGIQAGFNGQAIGLSDFRQNKPPFLQHPDLDYYAFYAQFDALTGDMLFAKVFESNLTGNESLSIVRADALGNSYISGTNIAGASAVTKISPDGDMLWSKANGHFLLSVAADGSALTLLGSQQLITFDIDGNALFYADGWLESLFDDPDAMLGGDNPPIQFYYHGSLLDESGDIYLLYTQDDRLKDFQSREPGKLTTLVMKIRGADGQVLWSKNIDPNGFSEASSIIFDPQGNLLVSGFTYGDFNGQTSFGGFDAYLATISTQTGEVLNTTIIGSEGYETASQAILDAENNLYLSGDFSSRYYSLEGSGYQNVYLISDDGFTLMGDAQSNEIYGGNGSDSISGGVGDDTLVGGSGNDKVLGGVGRDLIVGGDGAGDDVYDGGEGVDSVRFTSATAGITVNLAAARDHARSSQAGDLAGIGVDQLMSIENIIASYYDDILTGNAADNVFAGMTGNDVIDGGAGFDTVEIASLFADVTGVALAGDGSGLKVTSAQGRDSMINVERVQFLDVAYAPTDLLDLLPISPEFSIVTNGVSAGASPTLFKGDASLKLHYQLIDKTPGAIIAGSALNDFIVLQGGGNKAVNGGLGNDVIDGGTGSTFVSGGGGANTFFLDGRASGVSWSTITDFQFGQDKATIWGWKEGVSRVKEVVENGGATGYSGLTLHFENLLPDGSASSARNANLNSITFTSKSLSDFGVESVAELNQQIASGSNSHFIVGATNDVYGEHGYLFIS